jgi:hypothetical protein
MRKWTHRAAMRPGLSAVHIRTRNRVGDAMKDFSTPSYTSPYNEREYFHLLREAATAIVEAKARRDSGALNELSKLIKRNAKPPGDKPTESENRKMIERLRQLPPPRSLRAGKLKPLAISGGGELYLKRQRVLHTQLKRFCLRAHDMWQGMERPDRQFWWLPKYSAKFRERCGFRIPREASLLKDAIRIGAQYCPTCRIGQHHQAGKKRGETEEFLWRILEAH